jgi:glycolate oxidase FAD binding subunit
MELDTRDLAEFTTAGRTDLPAAPHRLAPTSPEETAEVMAAATAAGAVVVPWGGGTHQGLGRRVAPDVVLATSSLDRIVAWEPDDLTVVVEAGVVVDDLERELATRNQTAALPETTPDATVGGVISAGVSGYRRPRYGPTRDRILQTTLATGDGRLVTAGGRVVKNVSGYDIQRSVFGAHGSLGVITSVCLKLWPRATTSATIAVDDPVGAWKTVYRPLAVLETESGSAVYVEGPPQQVDTDVVRLGGARTEGLLWPRNPLGDVTAAVTVAPAETAAAVERIRPLGPFVAQHGVGRVDVAGRVDTDWGALRAWAEERGGRLTVMAAPDTFYDGFDAWGVDPPALDVQRRLIAAFDPARIVNRGRLPGGI